MNYMQTPFPWFGGKGTVAETVWKRFGDVKVYLEPFFGGGSCLLNRPSEHIKGKNKFEYLNDLDGNVANFWRAVRHEPGKVASWASYPIHELDLHAIGRSLFQSATLAFSKTPGEFAEWLRKDDMNYCPERAGKWCWFTSNWIGGLPQIGGPVYRRKPKLDFNGIRKILPEEFQEIESETERRLHTIKHWMNTLSDRLRNVVCLCGDWSRVVSDESSQDRGVVGVFLDPPYSGEANRHDDLYSVDCVRVAHEVRKWCIKTGSNPKYRIALCGYSGEHKMPDNWFEFAWKSHGFVNSKEKSENQGKERIWFSPSCLNSRNLLFPDSE
jgi:site-specific DNA-adenine methylase